MIDIFRLFCCIPKDVSFSPLVAFVTHKKIQRNSPKILHPRFWLFDFFYSHLWKSKNASIARCAIAKGRPATPPGTGGWKKGHLPPSLNFFSSFSRFWPQKILLRSIVRKNLSGDFFLCLYRGVVASYQRRRAGVRGGWGLDDGADVHVSLSAYRWRPISQSSSCGFIAA